MGAGGCGVGGRGVRRRKEEQKRIERGRERGGERGGEGEREGGREGGREGWREGWREREPGGSAEQCWTCRHDSALVIIVPR